MGLNLLASERIYGYPKSPVNLFNVDFSLICPNSTCIFYRLKNLGCSTPRRLRILRPPRSILFKLKFRNPKATADYHKPKKQHSLLEYSKTGRLKSSFPAALASNPQKKQTPKLKINPKQAPLQNSLP